jgi:hypothetical protein
MSKANKYNTYEKKIAKKNWLSSSNKLKLKNIIV